MDKDTKQQRGSDSIDANRKNAESPAEFQSSVVFPSEVEFEETLTLAERNNPSSQLKLGQYFEIVRKDKWEALKWYELAAQQGHAGAQIILGSLYRTDHWVKKDHSQAIKWFLKAAEQGEAYAQLHLGCMLYNGEGTERNYQLAAKWFWRAAEHGETQSQCILAGMYADGVGIEKDYLQAYALFNLASVEGNQYSAGRRDELEAKMCPSQVAEAQKRAAEIKTRIKETQRESKLGLR
jgi:uncharacterized protein